jgi:class 3 adenylate cyclase
MASPVTHNLTILLTDIKGFTDKTSRKSRSDIQEMLEKHKAIVLPVLESRGGKLVKTIGDAFLMVFESPTDAVLAGTAVQDELAKYNADKTGDDRIEIRIAINLGEVNLADNDVFGEPVNITARIEAVAEAGEVFFTEAVYLAMNKKEVPSSEIGLRQWKGIPEKIRVYTVRREHPVGGGGSAPSKRFPWSAGGPKALPAAALGSFETPKWPRRAMALFMDGLLCTMIVGALVQDADPVKVQVPGVRIDDSGVHVEAGEKANIHIDDDGVRIDAGGSKITVGEKGVAAADAGGAKLGLKGKRAEKAPARKLAFPLVWAFYSTLFLGLFAATPGKHLFRLRVVQLGGGPLTWRDAALRSVSSLLSGYVFFIGYLWAVREPEQRGWHDLIAGTKVLGFPKR